MSEQLALAFNSPVGLPNDSVRAPCSNIVTSFKHESITPPSHRLSKGERRQTHHPTLWREFSGGRLVWPLPPGSEGILMQIEF